MIEKIKVNINEEGKTKRILKYIFKKNTSNDMAEVPL